MDQQHTKGPWIVENTLEVLWIGTGKNNNSKVDEIVTKIYWDDNYKDSVKEKLMANAKLIAAAPELLEACEWATAFGHNGAVHDRLIREKLEAAIKKATE